jgi:hypothetical protein
MFCVILNEKKTNVFWLAGCKPFIYLLIKFRRIQNAEIRKKVSDPVGSSIDKGPFFFKGAEQK